jgi:hypothetical protein
MSTHRQKASVSRTYTPDSDACLQAVSYLLKNSARKKGTRPGAPDDAKEIKSVRATSIIPNQP